MVRLYAVLIAMFSTGLIAEVSKAAQYAVPRVVEKETKSGAPVLLGLFVDCKTHVPYQGSAFAQHGQVIARDVSVRQCGSPKEPARAYWYTSNPGYKGVDEVVFSSGSAGSFLTAHVTVR
jgi:hypothetical protein